MGNRYKVIQWATGITGQASLRAVIRNPNLELVAVKVYSPDKDGKDAGHIIGLDSTEITCTVDPVQILSTDADCVIYSPMPWDVEEICAILMSGRHVITPCPYWFPFVQDSESASLIQEACQQGGVNFHASGINPGGIAEKLPMTLSGLCNRLDRITMTEYGDCRDYGSEGVIRDLMNLGRTPEEADNNPVKDLLTNFWNEPIDMIAEGLKSEIIKYSAEHNYVLASEDIETASGTIRKGTIGLNNYRHIGVTKEGTEIIQEQIWFMDDLGQNRLEREMDIPQDSGWRIRLEGDVNLVVDVKLDAPTQPERTAMGISLTGFHCANSVSVVCEATPPGIKTFLNLPIVTSDQGSYTIFT